MKNLIVKDEEGKTVGNFPIQQYGPCALTVATFGQYVMFGNLVVWFNNQDGDASESYDTFAEVVYRRISKENIRKALEAGVRITAPLS